MTFSLQEPTSIPDCVPAIGKRVFLSRNDTPLSAGTSTGRAQDQEKELLHELIKTGILLANFVLTVLKVPYMRV
jgi:uracil DNA glycosylase